MTKKRYIKLLMAQGHSRNYANECAQEVADAGGRCSYEEAYALAYALDRTNWISAAHQLGDVIESITASMIKVVNAVAAGIAAFGKAFRDAYENG